MSNFWQPQIDSWAPVPPTPGQASINNTTANPTSYKYAPNWEGAPYEGEEEKVQVAGLGKITYDELKTAIKTKLEEARDCLKTCDRYNIDKLKHILNSPELKNFIEILEKKVCKDELKSRQN